MKESPRRSLEFFVNGIHHRVADHRAFWTLTKYLREDQQLTGTKNVCNEGDCGSCSVLLGRPADDGADRMNYRTVDSCIVFLHQIDRTHIVTVEGLAHDDGTPTAVQRAMIDGHGSQCGFCTPGFVVAMHGMHEEAAKKQVVAEQADVADGDEAIGVDGWRVGLSGNLCRCTGYVQILKAARAIDPAGLDGMNRRYPPAEMLRCIRSLGDGPVAIEADSDAAVDRGHSRPRRLFIARTLDDAVRFRAEHPTARIVSGATDVGVQHNHGRDIGDTLLGIRDVPELTSITVDDDNVRFGAAATWTDVLNVVDETFPAFDPILLRFGSPQIRNIGSIGGNLANGSPIADSVPFLFALDATIEAVSPRGRRRIPIDRFYTGYKQLSLDDDELIAAVTVRRPGPNDHLWLSKVSRRADMDISTFTAAIFVSADDAGVITAARVAMGGVGPVVLRIREAEEAMIGQPLNLETLDNAGRLAAEQITPIDDVRGSADYRRRLARNVFHKFFHERAGGADAGRETVST